MTLLPLLISQIALWLAGHSVWLSLHLVFVASPLSEVTSYPEFSSRGCRVSPAGQSCSQTESKATASKNLAASRPFARCRTEEPEAPSWPVRKSRKQKNGCQSIRKKTYYRKGLRFNNRQVTYSVMKRIQLFAPSCTSGHAPQVSPDAAQRFLQLAHLCQQSSVRNTIHFLTTEKVVVRCE